MKPDVFLSNGPVRFRRNRQIRRAVIQKVIESGTPTFGNLPRPQMLGLAVGAENQKMHQGHHGANHAGQGRDTGKVEITSMNHGFCGGSGDAAEWRNATISLFDAHCGISLDGSRCSRCSIPRASPARALALSVQAVCGFDAGKEGRLSAHRHDLPGVRDSKEPEYNLGLCIGAMTDGAGLRRRYVI